MIYSGANEAGILGLDKIAIFDSNGFQVLSISGPVMKGNHQAHSN
jgi:hypothetical protein